MLFMTVALKLNQGTSRKQAALFAGVFLGTFVMVSLACLVLRVEPWMSKKVKTKNSLITFSKT
jgi:hypothetical protein